MSQPYVSTYRGRIVKLSEMDHQHLSNWIWYSKLVLELEDDSETMQPFRDELKRRFNSIVLPYKPKRDFHYEIANLALKGYLTHNEKIVVDGKVVGQVAAED